MINGMKTLGKTLTCYKNLIKSIIAQIITNGALINMVSNVEHH